MNLIERFHVAAPDTSAGGGRVVGLFKGNSGAGKHAGVIAFGVTTSLGAEIASLPSQFRGKSPNSRKNFIQK